MSNTTGGESNLVFKSYDQRREAFQGTEQDVIWLDEEPPRDIHTECLLRTMTNNGMVMLTFTPLLGMSSVVLEFLPSGKFGTSECGDGKYVVMATWDDAPHLDEAAKKELWASIPPFQRDARSKGIPQLGAGAIYPVPESDLLVDPFPIPIHWPRGYGMDVGWNNTAAVWGPLDRDHDVLYLTGEYKRSHAEPSIHAHGLRAPGDWMPGFIDPASRGRSQKDGSELLGDYRNLGLNLQLADNGVESGLYSVWNRMSTGRLKVFRSMVGWLGEFRLYRRDEKGRIVKENDHFMDCTRYLEKILTDSKNRKEIEGAILRILRRGGMAAVLMLREMADRVEARAPQPLLSRKCWTEEDERELLRLLELEQKLIRLSGSEQRGGSAEKVAS